MNLWRSTKSAQSLPYCVLCNVTLPPTNKGETSSNGKAPNRKEEWSSPSDSALCGGRLSGSLPYCAKCSVSCAMSLFLQWWLAKVIKGEAKGMRVYVQMRWTKVQIISQATLLPFKDIGPLKLKLPSFSARDLILHLTIDRENLWPHTPAECPRLCTECSS